MGARVFGSLSIVALAAACGPANGWEEPDLVSACGTRDPIEVSARGASPYNFAVIGDDWSIATGRMIDDTWGVFDTVLFDPCGEGDIEVLESSVVRPAGDGYVLCNSENGPSWVEFRGASPAPLAPSEHCMSAMFTEHGVFIDDDEGRLLLFASPGAEPRVIATEIAEAWGPSASDPLWTTAGEFVWSVTGDGQLERFDLATGERSMLADGVESLDLAPQRDAVVWTRGADDSDLGTTTIHLVANASVIELPGYLHGLWPGLVVVGTATTTTLFDISTGTSSEVRTPTYVNIVRVDHGADTMLVTTASTKSSNSLALGRVDLATGAYHYLTDISISGNVFVDPHGDGLVVEELVDDHPEDDEPTQDRLRILRISRSGTVRVVVDSAYVSFTLAADGRLLYKPLLPDKTQSPDLHVRNPDGTDRVFARNASLVAPVLWLSPYASTPDAPDLEGDVLVNIASGDTGSLWRMPFDPLD